MADPRKNITTVLKTRKFLNKDFDGFLTDLNEYARTYYGDKAKDITTSNIAGLFLDLASYVGDVQSFYLDHQFHETSPETAVEPRNIERHLRDAGVPIVGASPAVVNQTFIFKVPADTSVSPPIPLSTCLPFINSGVTNVVSDSGIIFELTEDIDFREVDANGDLTAEVVVGDVDTNNNPINFILKKKGLCISGQRATESFFNGNFQAFRRYTLSKENVTQIIRVKDDLGNLYYEVDFLTEDTVFEALTNKNDDNQLVKDVLQIKPAPYRFYSRMDLNTRLSTLTFGGGSAQTTDEDIIPDPSELALPLYGKRTFNRFSINPNNLLSTTTLGIIASNTNVTVEYRFGGGLSHNVEKGTIRNLNVLSLDFPNNPSSAQAANVRQTIRTTNEEDAGGGDDAPLVDDLKLLVPKYRASQSRIVSKEDLLARLYNLPANFGRVFRATVKSNPNNPNASQLFIISRNANKELVVSPDTLKKNMAIYLNKFRLISDAIDVLDARIINLQLKYQIVIDPDYNKQLILQNINSKLQIFFDIKNFQIDQPINISEVRNVIFNNEGIISVENIQFYSLSGQQGEKIYSQTQFDVKTNTFKGLLIPTSGGIFELKYPLVNIIGIAV